MENRAVVRVEPGLFPDRCVLSQLRSDSVWRVGRVGLFAIAVFRHCWRRLPQSPCDDSARFRAATMLLNAIVSPAAKCSSMKDRNSIAQSELHEGAPRLPALSVRLRHGVGRADNRPTETAHRAATRPRCRVTCVCTFTLVQPLRAVIADQCPRCRRSWQR
jgi:hypothetical protein